MSYSACKSGHNRGSADCSISHKDSIIVKSAVLKMSNSVVSVLTYDFPDDMLHYNSFGRLANPHSDTSEKEPVFWGSGLIVDCDDHSDCGYIVTILTVATMFKRSNDIEPKKIKVDVYFYDGSQIGAEVVCCDFHYNLAIIRVHTNLPSPVAKLRELEDRLHVDSDQSLSNAMTITSGELAIVVHRYFLNGDHKLMSTPVFHSKKRFSEENAEVYGLECCSNILDHGGPVINRFGEVIGIRFHNDRQLLTPFLPINVVSRWLSFQKKIGEFRRPWLGIEICNLHAVDFNVLERFQGICSGVYVTKVLDDSPAKFVDIRSNDVIVQCDGVEVCSIMEFFERIWEKGVEEYVELRIVRPHKSSKSRVLQRKRTLKILETTRDNFYRWRIPRWRYIMKERDIS